MGCRNSKQLKQSIDKSENVVEKIAEVVFEPRPQIQPIPSPTMSASVANEFSQKPNNLVKTIEIVQKKIDDKIQAYLETNLNNAIDKLPVNTSIDFTKLKEIAKKSDMLELMIQKQKEHEIALMELEKSTVKKV